MIRDTFRAFRKNRLAVLGAGCLVALLATAIFAPWIAPHDPYEMHLTRILEGPTREFPFGTDNLGRCLLSRIIYGARISLLAAFVIVLISGILGTTFGTVAGYYGGVVDALIMRTVDILMALPQLLIILGIIAVIGPSLINILLVVSLISWTDFARLARGGTVSLREAEYVLAARAYGTSGARILFKHIIPNNLAPIIVMATLRMAYTILMLAGLSYLGFGVQPPTPSWGGIISIGQKYLIVSPWMAIFGGLAVVVTILSFNFIGDGLRDALDPKLKTRLLGA